MAIVSSVCNELTLIGRLHTFSHNAIVFTLLHRFRCYHRTFWIKWIMHNALSQTPRNITHTNKPRPRKKNHTHANKLLSICENMNLTMCADKLLVIGPSDSISYIFIESSPFHFNVLHFNLIKISIINPWNISIMQLIWDWHIDSRNRNS